LSVVSNAGSITAAFSIASSIVIWGGWVSVSISTVGVEFEDAESAGVEGVPNPVLSKLAASKIWPALVAVGWPSSAVGSASRGTGTVSAFPPRFLRFWGGGGLMTMWLGLSLPLTRKTTSRHRPQSSSSSFIPDV